MKKALVILSGGQDSTTCLYWAMKTYQSENVMALTFDYGQRHRVEIDAARRIASNAGIYHEVVEVESLLSSTSPLTSDNKLHEYLDYASMLDIVGDRIEDTFVPMRNAFFLVMAVNRAIAWGCTNVVIGVSEADTANYPDCTREFLVVFEDMAYRATRRGIRVIAPLSNLNKADTVRLAKDLGSACWRALAYTHTSYAGEYPPVSMNHANILRARGFEEAGFADPLVVRAINEGLMPIPATANYDYLRGSIDE